MNLPIDSMLHFSLIMNVLMAAFIFKCYQWEKKSRQEKKLLREEIVDANFKANIYKVDIEKQNRYIESLENKLHLSSPGQPHEYFQAMEKLQAEYTKQSVNPQSMMVPDTTKTRDTDLYACLRDIMTALDRNSQLKEVVKVSLAAPAEPRWNRIMGIIEKYQRENHIIK